MGQRENELNEIQNQARLLATLYPEAAVAMNRAAENMNQWRHPDSHEESLPGNEREQARKERLEWHGVAQDAYREYSEQCKQSYDALYRLMRLVYRWLPDTASTLRQIRLVPEWRANDPQTDWPAIVEELRRIEDAALIALSSPVEQTADSGQQIKGKKQTEAEPTSKPVALTEREQSVLDYIIESGPKTGKEIVDELELSSESVLTRQIIPKLRSYGVRNRRNCGYYVEES